ncbi:MAG: Major facilitator superfamily 1 transporter [Burkholderiales bacterium]|jgi:MFS family permease|nr:Major facilitator superfamily 1 transporter [Burkholderiales bacterium]
MLFILGLSAFMIIAGRIADVYARRTVLYIGMIIFGLSSLFAGLTTNMLFLILCRALQSISCTILYTATGAIASNTFLVTQREKAMGILFGVNALDFAVGPVLAGFIVGMLNWRWVFF